MPMYNWVSIYEEKDLSFLSKNGKICKRVEGVYNRMLDELITSFGVSEDYLKLQNNKIEIELYYDHQFRTGDKSNQVFIEILEIDNQELESKNTKTDLFDAVISIKESLNFEFEYLPRVLFGFLWLKVRNNPLTVYEYHKYSERVSKKNK